MASVTFRNVTKKYGDLQVIHGVTADVADGEFVVIVGPSGCGKSTLLRMVAGLEVITSGEIAIGDRVVNKLEPKDRDIAMVFQNYALYPHMSVFDNMAFGLKMPRLRQGRDRARVDGPPASSAGASCSSASPGSSPAASGSASRWAAPSSASRRVPVRRAAVEPGRQAARADARRDSSSCTAGSAPRRSTSPTTRSRR